MSQHTVLWGICGLHSAEYQCDSHQIIKKLKWWPDERPTQSSDIQNTDDSTRYSYHMRVGRLDTRQRTVSGCWDSKSGYYETENNKILTSNTGSYRATQFGILVLCTLRWNALPKARVLDSELRDSMFHSRGHPFRSESNLKRHFLAEIVAARQTKK